MTEGNPLFISESLLYLHNEGLLFLDEKKQWLWNIDNIRKTNMPTNVVTLFSSKIQKLPQKVVTLLEYCACMGNTFSPEELSMVKGTSLFETFETLKPALEQGLLIESKEQLRFIHDRVQEAALAGITEERRRQIHWQVGNRLLSALPEKADIEKIENLFIIVAHLNLGREETIDQETAYLLSDLNYHAGNKALNSLAIEAANKYFNLSKDLLPEDCWENVHHQRSFKILQKAAKTELMCGNHENSEKLINQLLDHAKTSLDKAECLAEQTVSLSSMGSFAKAIETANKGLAYFGKALPDSIEEVDKKREKLVHEITSKNIDIYNTLLNMPFAVDRRAKVEHAFYSELLACQYLSGLAPQFYLTAAQATLHCLSSGLDDAVIYAFVAMGIYHAEREEFEQSFVYEDLTHDLAAKYPNTFAATKCMNGIVWTLMHSRSHPRDIVDYCLKAFQCGKNCGDINNAGISFGPLMWNLQVQGTDLSAVESCSRECIQFAKKYNLSFAVGLGEAMQAGWIEPMKKAPQSMLMEQKIAQWNSDNHIASSGSYYFYKALSHYYSGEYEETKKHLDNASKYLPGLSNNILKREWHVFKVLNDIKLYEKVSNPENRQELMAQIQISIKKIEKWASLGPLLKPYLAFLYAELEKVTGEFKEARSLYLDAINSAREQEYIFLEGHVNECLGDLLRANNQSPRVYVVEASRLYRRCSAERKERQLIEKYHEYFEKETSSPIEVDFSSRVLPDLDIEYLLKLALAISAEIEQESLLKKIMDVAMESSGAQHGYLLIEEQGKLLIQAESHAANKETIVLINKSLEDASDLCKAIVHYVHRTREQLVLNNASQEGVFKDNPEVQDLQLRSVLCLPVIKQSKINGLLYLENRLSDFFTPSKTNVVELLVSQIAISLENANLFEERRKAEEAVRKSEQRWATTLASIGDAVISSDSLGKITYMNAVAEELTGWTLHEALHKPVKEVFYIINERTRLDVEDPVGKVLEKGMIVGLANHTILVRKDKTEVPIDDSGAPIKDENGEITGVVLVFRDITERKKAEEALSRLNEELEERVRKRTSEVLSERQRLYSILETLPVYVVLLDKDYRMPFANKVFRESFGESHGRRCHDYLFKRDSPCENCETYKVLKTNKPHHWEWMGPNNHYYDIYDFPFIEADGSFLILEMGIDITERKKAELLAQESESKLKAAERLAAIGATAGMVGHDIRNPLQAITSDIFLVKSDLSVLAECEEKERVQESLRYIEKNVEYINKIVADLQDFAKPLKPTIEALDIEILINELLLKKDIPDSIQVNVKINNEVKKIVSDSTYLKRVLGNLILNAVQAMPDGGTLSVFAYKEAEDTVITVTDTGVGIPDEVKAKLFTPMLTTKSKGQGFGLPVVKRLVEALNGTVTFESKAGEGTKFIIRFSSQEKN